jgi:hypothetical protein
MSLSKKNGHNYWSRGGITALITNSFALITVVGALVVSQTVFAQAGLAVDDSDLQLATVREEQLGLATRAGVVLFTRDEGLKSVSRIATVPAEMQSFFVANEGDLVPHIPELYPYFGFTGSETLQFTERRTSLDGSNIFEFQQYIDGIPVAMYVDVWVNPKTLLVDRINGYAAIDRGFERTPEVPEETAIALVMQYIGRDRNYEQESSRLVTDTQVTYQSWGEDGALTAIWEVKLSMDNGRGLEPAESFLVSNKGEVISTTSTSNATSSVRACVRGMSPTSDWCGSAGGGSNPVVIESDGSCQVGDCSAYQPAYDIVEGVQVMWEDIVPGTICCSVGDNNSNNGSTVDLVLGYDLPAPTVAQYKVQQSPAYGVILVEPGYETSIGHIAHEMGHAVHRWGVGNAYFVNPSTSPPRLYREHMATKEFIADMSAIIFQNYRGPTAVPKFETSADWVTPAGWDISDPVTIDEFRDLGPESYYYENARIGGHAIYELATNPSIGPELAANLFYRGIANLGDKDGDAYITFSDVRVAMIEVAATVGTAQANAVRDAWDTVGVGDYNTAIPKDTAPTGAPSTPTSFLVFDDGCYSGLSYSYVSYGTVSGADFYRFWGSVDGGFTWNYGGISGSNPQRVWATGAAKWRVSACNEDGCSIASDEDEIITANLCF